MRIREVRIHSYGPLSDLSLTDIGNFTLIFGENESGKTLFLDAILRFLLSKKRERDLFSRLDRVAHDPQGFVEISKDGERFQFPDDGSLPDVLKIPAMDLRNVLVVRASDLQLPSGEESAYYAELTDRLTGIHREPIQKIKEQLHKKGMITPTGKLSDAQEFHKIKSRVDDANLLLTEVDDLKEDPEASNLVALEADLLDAIDAREVANEELELLQEAKKRDAFDSGRNRLIELEQTLADIKKLPAIKQEHYNDWRDAENIIKDKNRDLERAASELNSLEETLKEAEIRLQAAQQDLQQLQRKKPAIDDLEKEAADYREKAMSAESWSPLVTHMPKAGAVLSILLLVAFLGILFQIQTNFFTIASVVIGALLLFIGVAWFADRAYEGRRRRLWEGLQMDAASLGVEVERIEELLQSIEDYHGNLEQAQSRSNDADTERGIAASRVGDQKERITQYQEAIFKAKASLNVLKESIGLTSFEDLEKARDKLNKLKERQGSLLAKLGEQFGEEGDSIEANIEGWRAEIEKLAKYEGAAPGIEYNASRETEIEDENKSLDERITELDEDLAATRKQISEITSEANRVLSPDQQLPGETLEDLIAIEGELQKFVQHAEDSAQLAWRAIEVFTAIQEEEEQKVKNLFGEEDLGSKYFKEITGGAYERVMYDPEDGELKVVRNNGEVLRAYSLSSGTYDQLYLATRLSLAHQTLGGEQGFLLLDDPFLSSDSKRLPRQLEILEKLASRGWQIVYFSVKNEVRSKLKNAIKAGRIELKDLPSIHSL